MSAPAQSPQLQLPPGRTLNLPTAATINDGGLFPGEIEWRDHQKWLKDQGYMLRRRYRTDWVPSWKGTKRRPYECEDGLSYIRRHIMDARRISDGTIVVLKRIRKSIHPHEAEISRMFSEEPLASDPHNHCIPIYEVLQSPLDSDIIFMVMPYLRRYSDPRFATVGEAVECIRQLLEGVQFLHKLRVAHRDIMNLNFMMDPTSIVSEAHHPHIQTRSYDNRRKLKFSTRTMHPVRYYIIDFGISRQYPLDCVSPREDPIWGGVKKVPEFHKSNEPCDPFPTDIFYTGYLLWEDFVERSADLDFLRPLVDEMMQEDPAKRPTIDEVIERFDKLRGSLSTWKLRSRVVHKKDYSIVGFFRALRHTYRTAKYILKRRPAIPTPT
ncbi:kinase-like protein [Trametes sanguinea]|nr:kinase-like protein [Trametes sanguinea]